MRRLNSLAFALTLISVGCAAPAPTSGIPVEARIPDSALQLLNQQCSTATGSFRDLGVKYPQVSAELRARVCECAMRYLATNVSAKDAMELGVVGLTLPPGQQDQNPLNARLKSGFVAACSGIGRPT